MLGEVDYLTERHGNPDSYTAHAPQCYQLLVLTHTHQCHRSFLAMAATMKQTYGEAPLHMLQPKALFNFASQTFGFVTQSLGYRQPASYTTADEDDSLCHFGLDIREKDEETGLDMYSLSEVAQHETTDDCWIVLFDKVFDVTSFMLEHPGGEDVILENAGRDATLAFQGVGHSTLALRGLDDYLIGIVSHGERIYTNQNLYMRGTR